MDEFSVEENMTDIDDQDRALGTLKSGWQRFIYKMQYPKYKTGHYNLNGNNVYTKNITIVAFMGIIFYVIVIVIFKLMPFFCSIINSNLFVSSELNRLQLTNPLGLSNNKTSPDQSKFYNDYWLPLMVSQKIEFPQLSATQRISQIQGIRVENMMLSDVP